MRRVAALALVAAGLVAVSTAAARPTVETEGRAQYVAWCGACHAVDANGVGPMDRDLVGRPVAALTRYRYSAALRRLGEGLLPLGEAWSPERLDQWLRDPQAMAPGSSMTTTVADPAVRRAIITYLATVSDTAPNPVFEK